MKKGDVYKHYPEAVQELVKPTMDVIADSKLDSDIRVDILEKLFSEIALQKFLSGSEMTWTETEFTDTLRTAFAHTQIQNLKDMKLIDSIEDENGEEVVWLTDDGKKLAEFFRESESYDDEVSIG